VATIQHTLKAESALKEKNDALHISYIELLAFMKMCVIVHHLLFILQPWINFTLRPVVSKARTTHVTICIYHS
jgi:hypothetical protein